MLLSKTSGCLCSVLVFLFLSGCAEAPAPVEYVRMNAGPAPQILAESGKPQTIPAGYIKRRLRLGVKSLEELVINDRQYLYVTEKWYREVISWVEEFIEKQVPGIDLIENPPAAYEETFVMLAHNIANISVAKRYNLRSSVLIGLLVAENVNSWGDIPADDLPRVYMVGLTENGGLVYDLRTKQMVKLEEFPNLQHIKGILL